jgi:kinesin family protein 3/17
MEPATCRGIIPRTFDHVFATINGTPNVQFLVRVQFLELYNEEIRDLLSKNHQNKLDIREKPGKGIYVKDLSEFVIHNASDLMAKLTLGRESRVVGATDMNKDSSRSHSIFSILIETSEVIDGQNKIRAGKLNLVDLAGSER